MDFFEIIPGHFINLRRANRIVIRGKEVHVFLENSWDSFDKYKPSPERIKALQLLLSSESVIQSVETLIQTLTKVFPNDDNAQHIQD